MSGKYRGLQAEIRNRNNLAFYVPCAAHSLNLVGQCSVEASTEASRYFMFLQKLYAFFANSTHRWDVLTRKLQENKKKFTLKSLSSTRWSCREDATKALEANYDEIYDSLTAIRDDPNEKKETKMESSSLVNTLEKFETAFMTIFWNTVLNQLGAVSNTLQKPGLDLNTGTQLLQGLQTSIKKHRENFECFEEKTKNLSTHVDFQYSKKRSDLKRKFPDGQSLHLEGSTKFKIETYYVSIDTLVSELDKRREAYSDISRLFGFFGDFRNIEEEELRECARKIVDTYKDDLDIALVEEIVFFRNFLLTIPNFENLVPKNMLDIIVEKDLISVFPNMYIVLRIYLTLAVTNCESERSFSKLSFIKNELRSSMGETRLVSLAICSIEHDVLRSINFEDIIKTFVRNKHRKKALPFSFSTS
ncbi:hypothetical protein PPYR_01578 [Photinus pyralis]|uniref:HAT C-terminal dimerisation domain-containing protein n=3 Tax=Photinus pyralis TaxID=7054 RepID=A0A5N4B4Z6_PHOPY|nr:uncharacterized protein LOC116159720 isoform X1 [Photinus pyralis]XP_031328643.1 uncharacterized protein LOC116159720 isoform X1 [Photinus pyralis]KAB0804608.1 hypothetical protein PPYR_01578 [Photinus pyralis]